MTQYLPNKYLTPISMVYMAIMICSDLLVHKSVNMHFGFTTAATFIFPLWFVLNDIIAEVYGYKTCRKILLMGFGIQLFFDIVCYFIIQLPSPVGWNNQAAFDLILGNLLRTALGTFAAFIIAGFINIYLITRWKILLSGRKFWLRSIGSSVISEVVYSLLNAWLLLLGVIPTSEIPTIIFWSLILKVVYIIILAYPALLVVQILKKAEGMDVYDNTLTFKLAVNQSYSPNFKR